MYSGTVHTTHTHVYTYNSLLPVDFYGGLLHACPVWLFFTFFNWCHSVTVAPHRLLRFRGPLTVGLEQGRFCHTRNVESFLLHLPYDLHPFLFYFTPTGRKSEPVPDLDLQINENFAACAHLCRSRSIVLRITSDPGKLHYFKEVYVTTSVLLFYVLIVSFSLFHSTYFQTVRYSYQTLITI